MGRIDIKWIELMKLTSAHMSHPQYLQSDGTGMQGTPGIHAHLTVFNKSPAAWNANSRPKWTALEQNQKVLFVIAANDFTNKSVFY